MARAPRQVFLRALSVSIWMSAVIDELGSEAFDDFPLAERRFFAKARSALDVAEVAAVEWAV